MSIRSPIVRFLSTQQKLVCQNSSISQNSYVDLSQWYYEALKTSASQKSKFATKKIHAQIVSSGLYSSTFLQNHLINAYSSIGLINDAVRVFSETEFRNVFSWNTMISGLADSGLMKEAEKLFDEMPDKDSVSWNSMMSGYFNNGKVRDTIKMFVLMVRDCCCVPDLFSFSCAMKACASLGYVKLAFQLHGLVTKFEFRGGTSISSSIIDMYIKSRALDYAERVFSRISDPNLFCWNSMIYAYSKFYGLDMALDLFNRMPERDVVSWNTMISILSQHGIGEQTLTMFVQMCSQGFVPNSMTYASVLSACTSIGDLQWGAHLHARVLRMVPNLDVYVGSGLIDMYAKCGWLEYAKQVFSNLKEQNEVSWTSLIGGVAQVGCEEEALEIFRKMREVPVASDEFTVATVLGVCSSLKDKSLGEQLHAYAKKIGVGSSVPVGNALVTMYAKCGSVQTANHAFDLMPVKDIISWTAIITAFSQDGNVKKAREYFDNMPERNVITWNSMLGTYIQNGFWEDGLKLYILMLRRQVKPDWITYATSLSACSYLAVMKLGNQIVAQAEKYGFSSDVTVLNSVVTMYSRCGRIGDAQKVFESIITKDIVTWNAMMSGYAQSGQGRKVIEIFEEMLKLGFKPDHISYVSILSGCSYSGLVPEGQYYFNLMTKCHGISPTCEHYVCMVDLLGRAGLLEQAINLINDMPLEPNAAVWGALLGGCRIHGNTELAEVAVSNLINIDVADSGSYVLLANLYSDSGKLEGVLDVRKLMRERRNKEKSRLQLD
ncbi:Pentatricopeptide repeat-containing protein [Forsythia ovata]|uniref:Pentatricopeptide repeat-containing protein n=1 Tax=Forsythia ovata TaxID=205694 RepID=A0ABD1UXV6_9LAMI